MFVITVSQRLRGISEEGENLKPKLEEAFQTLYGTSILDANGNLKSTFELLEIMAEQSDRLTDSQRQYVFELAAGKRQVPVLQAITSNWESVIGATEASIDSAGSARQEQELFLESIEGRLKTTTAQIQEFWATLLSTDGIKSTITFFGDFVEVLSDINKTFGSLPITIAAVTQALIIFKGTKIVGFINDWIAKNLVATTSTMGLNFATETLTVSVIDLQLAIGGVLAVLTLASIAYQDYTKRQAEARQEAEAFKKAQEELDNALEAGTKENLESRISTLEELGQAYATLQSQLASERNKASLGLDASELQKTADKIQSLERELAKVEKSFKENGVEVDKFSNTMDTLRDAISKLNSEEEKLLKHQEYLGSETELLTQAYKELSDSGEVSHSTMGKLLELMPDIAEELGINQDAVKKFTKEFENSSKNQVFLQQEITKRTIDEIQKRIKAYNEELSSLAANIDLKAEFAETPEQEKEVLRLEKAYLRTQDALNGSLDALEDMRSKQVALGNVMDKFDKKSSTSPSTKIDHEKEFFDLLEKVESKQQEIALKSEEINRAEGADKIPLLMEQNELYEEQRANLDNLTKARQKYIQDTKLDQEETEKLNDKIDEEILSRDKLSTSIHNNEKAIEDLNKEIEQNTIKALEKMKDEAEELADKYENDLTNAINKSIEALEKKRDKKLESAQSEIDSIQEEIDKIKEQNKAQEEANKLAEKELELAKLKEKRTNILAEKDTRIITGTGIDYVANPEKLRQNAEEISKVEQELTDLRLEQRENEKIQKLEKEKAELEESKRNIKENYDKRINDLKNFNKEQQRQVKENGRIEESLLKSIHKALQLENRTYFDDTIAGYRSMVDSINSELSRIKDIQGEIDGDDDEYIDDYRRNKKSSSSSSSSDKVNVKFSGGKTGSVSKGFYEKNKDKLQKLKTGGIVSGTGLVQVDGQKGKEEIMLNSKHIDRVGSALGFSGSTSQMASSLFNFANSIPNIQPVTNNTGGTIVENLNISLDNVTDGNSFVRDLKNLNLRSYLK